MSYQPKFVYKCLRVKKVEKPLKSRCGKGLGKNGILCDECYKEAQQHRIPILMCDDVGKMFNVPFKNQVFIWIDLTKGLSKEDSKSAAADKEREWKNKLWDEVDKLKIEDVDKMFTGLKLGSLSDMKYKYGKDQYKYRFFLTKAIVEHLITKGKAARNERT